MIFLLLVCSMIFSGSGLYLLLGTPEKTMLGWTLVGLGILVFILTVIYYTTRSKKKKDEICSDCVSFTPDCGIFPDCDGKPDCDCTPDCGN